MFQRMNNLKVLDKSWGDLGNGYYKNPILKADFSDPDVIRVKDEFFMVCSDFHYMGMQVLYSKDLVNWTIINQIYRELKIDPKYDNMEGYGQGSWAPSIRYHNGLFYVYFCTPEEGLYMSMTDDPWGKWSSLYEIKRVKGWEDPCPFWDEDGKAYLGHSTVGAGPIIIHRMSSDGKKLLDDGVIVYVGKVAEGTKIYKRNGYYYLIIPEGGVEKGWQTALRSKDIYGPYERKVVLSQGKTSVNGPHQGALIDTLDGKYWFIHFQSMGALGRVCHLQPVNWIDDWPVMGLDGEPVSIYKKPIDNKEYSLFKINTSDSFDKDELGCQWQWNHNPVEDRWSLKERPGYLRLKAMISTDIMHARNILTQKLIGDCGMIIVEIDLANMAKGQIAGLVFLGKNMDDNYIGILKDEEKYRLIAVTDGIYYYGPEFENNNIWLRADYNFSDRTYFSFSFDGKEFIPIGGNCSLTFGYWKGARIGLFTYNSIREEGTVDFRNFIYEYF